MDIQDIFKLMDKLSESRINRLELEWQGGSLKLDKGPGEFISRTAAAENSRPGLAAEPVRAEEIAGKKKQTAGEGAGKENRPAEENIGKENQPAKESFRDPAELLVKSPLVGTYYQAATPEAQPFVRAGQAVKKGQILCLIEAMKIINEIPAPAEGVITEVLAVDGSLVSFDQPLFGLRRNTDV